MSYDDLPKEGKRRAYHPTIRTPADNQFVNDYLDSGLATNYSCDEVFGPATDARTREPAEDEQPVVRRAGFPLPDDED